MGERIAVSGMGIVSSLGIGVDAQSFALRHSIAGLRYPEILRTRHTDLLLGEVPVSDARMATMAGADSALCTRTSLLGITALQEIAREADMEKIRNEPHAFINANTVGGMATIENVYSDLASDVTTVRQKQVINLLDCAESTQFIASHFKLNPFLATISTACSSSANAIIFGARLIRNGIVKRAICGGCDSLSKFTVNGFLSLKNVDKSPSRPFDQYRDGLNLGEGAAYLLLEKEEDAVARNANIYALLSGYNNSNDAYHPTAPAPDGAGAYKTMQHALSLAALNPTDIDYIHAHGTATRNNDLAEGRAIQNLFGEHLPDFSSTKPFTGHTLAAAGAIGAVFSILAVGQQFVPPNLNFDTPMEELVIRPARTSVPGRPIRNVLSNSFGFGGSNVSLVFSMQ